MTAASSTTGATAAPMPSRSSSLSYSSMGGAANDDDNDSRHGRGRKGRGRCTPPAKAMTRRQSTMIVIAPLVVPFVVLAATAAISDAVVAVPPRGTRRRRRHHLRRSLGSLSICGSNWGDANAACLDICESDEDCGPGRYCFHYMECIVGASNSTNSTASPSPAMGTAMAATADPDAMVFDEELSSFQEYSAAQTSPGAAAPSPTVTTSSATTPNYVPSYIASLPVRPSEPTTFAPFILPVPTPNTLPNPNGNYCGYGYESANAECFHSCPSGLDSECPGGRTCHTWLKCTRPEVDPAVYNVCGRDWAHASTSCAKRCYFGNEDACPTGETCWGGVVECEGNENLPPLTAVDVGLEEMSYTEEEIAILLDEEIEKERAEAAMEDPNNWWCGTSWTNMLETCAKRCTADADCKVNSWDEATCYKTPGGPENCIEVGVPVKEAAPPGSRWCGSTWNDMLETCSKMCEVDEDCDAGKKCWEGPDTCMYIGVPVKVKSEVASLWCGVDFDDAMTSCHKPCPSESDDECDAGMSCFAGSECTVAGEPIVREGYRCGTTWDDAALNCGMECQKNDDCDVDAGQECFAEVICAGELDAAGGGMFCGVTWEGTAKSCTESCEVDEDCGDGQWCYWVECESEDGDVDDDEEVVDETNDAMEEPEEEEIVASCNAEVKECPNGDFVGRAQELNCDFYPCPGEEEAVAEGGIIEGNDDLVSSTAADGEAFAGNSGEAADVSSGVDLTGWGSTPLAHACTSDGFGTCGLCQGDCNSDEDCLKGLLCFSRGEGEMTAVPGCVSGGDGDKPGMDYCYTPFQPEPVTTTADEEEQTTTMAAEIEETTTNPWDVDDEGEVATSAQIDVEETSVSLEEEEASSNVWEDNDEEEKGEEPDYADVELVYARECTADQPCGQCEGDCDDDTHCAYGLSCFMRDAGSVELVPGCSGLGTAGMDYCHGPSTPAPAPTSGSDGEAVVGCSAEVFVCPGGHIVSQDPGNNCEFEPCPTSASSMVSDSTATDEPDDTTPTAMPSAYIPTSDAPTSITTATSETYSPTAVDVSSTALPEASDDDASTYYCGFSLDQVNDNCQSAKPCPSLADDECDGLEVCISGTGCGSIDADVITTSPPVEESCDELCLEVLPTEFCPSDLILPNCLEVGLGEVCEGSGECGTNDKLNNCGTYDVYARVVCGFDTPSQGELMRSTTAPSPSVSTALMLLSTPPTKSPLAIAVSPTALSLDDGVMLTGAPVGIADAIANATANANATQSSSSSVQGPSSPPIQEYQSSNVAAAISFDRDQGSGGTNEASLTNEAVESGEWFDGSGGGSSGESDGIWEAPSVSDGGWNFDTAYFEKSTSSGIRSRRIPFRDATLKILGTMFMVLYA